MKIEDRILQLEQQILDMEQEVDKSIEEIKLRDERLDELVKSNSDFDNLLISAEIGALFIDKDMNIRKMTPIMTKNTNLRLADTGCSVQDIRLMDNYSDFVSDVKRCMESGDTIEREIQQEGTTLLLRFCPYYMARGGTDGILVTLFDITRRLEAAKFELQLLINNIPGAVAKMRYDNGLIIEYANDTMYGLMKMDRRQFRELYDSHYERLIDSKDWIRMQKNIEECIQQKKRVSMEYRVVTGKNTHEWRVMQASILEKRGETPILQCVITDITEDKLVRLELEKERKKLGTVVKMSGDKIFEYDIAEDHMTYTSPGEGLLFSTQITENYTKNLSKIIWKEDSEARHALVDALRSGKENFSVEFRRKDVTGEYHWVQVTGQTLFDKEHNPEKVLGKIQNIDEQKQKEEELRDKSQKDSLTGLLNHMTAKEIVKEKLEKLGEDEKCYLMVCDIDNFKAINDLNGHMFGDAVLCSFADEMAVILPDAIKGRIGGDEFMVYMEHTERDAFEELLRRLNRSMSDRYDDDKATLHISCSLGVAEVKGGVCDFDTLFQWADHALYRVKNSGKGSYCIIDVKGDMSLPLKSYLDSDSNKDMYVRKETLIRNDEELLLFCVELLENVPNITSALKMICERTCSFFDLNDMVCVEHDGNQNRILYQWSKTNRSEYTRRMYEHGIYEWDLLFSKADEQGIVVYREEESRDIEKEEAKSVLLVLSKEMKDYCGSIIFTDHRKDREWNRERETLHRISVLIFTHLRILRNEEKEKREMDRRLNYDALTGLPVYNRFVQQTEEYMAEHGKRGLFCIYSDFSNFQYLNEVYGYEAGDKVLHDFAKSLTEDYADGILFCRVTSDHFLGFMKAENMELAIQSYHSFTQRFAIRISSQYRQCNPVIASGIYEVSGSDKNVAGMMDNANEARKICKTQKVETAVVAYTEEIRQQTESTKTIVANMVSAYNNKEFHAYLQPKISLKTGKIVGAEALVRWIRPDGTMMMPGQFIDIFERNGFVTKVDFVILESVMEYLRDAMDAGEEVVPISVNFSRRHNEFDGFVPSFFKRLDTYKVPAQLLEVELTESVFLSDLSRLNKNLKSIRDRGIAVSVDDFGSGYSSLNLLSKVTVDTIKLDKQFLDNTLNASQEENALTVIKYLIKMLKHLGFQVLAEGVETEAQLEMLKKAECDYVQGYFYAKPMPIPEFREFLKKFNGE